MKSRGRASVIRPRFISFSMWFAFLLRSDIRMGAAPGDLEAQREFIAWWLLWGQSEYPLVWHWGSCSSSGRHAACTDRFRSKCPRLLRRLHSSRPDLQLAFPLQDEESLAEFFCWYRVYGSLELDAAPQLPAACLAMTDAPSQRQTWSGSVSGSSRRHYTRSPEVKSSAVEADSLPYHNLSVSGTRNMARNFLPPPTLPPAPSAARRPALRRAAE